MNDYAITASVLGGIIVVCSAISFLIRSSKRFSFPYPSIKNGSFEIGSVRRDDVSSPYEVLIMISIVGFFVLLFVYLARR
jgi:hypothetical protein